MGMGWKNSSGGLWSKCKCDCGKGEVLVYISDHEESDYPPFTRDESYSGATTCPDKCVNIEGMSEIKLRNYCSSKR